MSVVFRRWVRGYGVVTISQEQDEAVDHAFAAYSGWRNRKYLREELSRILQSSRGSSHDSELVLGGHA